MLLWKFLQNDFLARFNRKIWEAHYLVKSQQYHWSSKAWYVIKNTILKMSEKVLFLIYRVLNVIFFKCNCNTLYIITKRFWIFFILEKFPTFAYFITCQALLKAMALIWFHKITEVVFFSQNIDCYELESYFKANFKDTFFSF